MIECEKVVNDMLISQFVPNLADEAQVEADRLNARCGCPHIVKYVVKQDEDGWHMVWRVAR